MINKRGKILLRALDHDSDGVHRSYSFRSPLCINTFRFDIYRDWEIDKILVFEAFIIYTFKYGNGFYKTMKNLVEDLRLKKYTIQKHIKFFEEKGYIHKKLSSEEQNYKNIYTVNFEKIIDDIAVIYKFDLLNGYNSNCFPKYLYEKLFNYYAAKTLKDDEISSALYYSFQVSQ